MDLEDVLLWLMLLLVLAILGLGATEHYHQARQERICMSHGYPHADWRWFGPNYCIKHVDRADIVVNADTLR